MTRKETKGDTAMRAGVDIPPPSTRTDRHRLLAGLLVVAALGIGPGACDREEPGASPPEPGPVSVTVSSATEGPTVTTHPATVASTDEIGVATRSSGLIRRIPVEVGSVVTAGDVLAEVDASDVEARIRGAEAGVERARTRYRRIRNLERDGAATEQELDDAHAALRSAQASLEEARSQREYVVLRAPVSGTVTSRHADPGDLAVPGKPILELLRPGSLEVVADLPGKLGARVAVGDTMTIRDPETGGGRPATVTAISPARDPITRRTRVELRFTAHDLVEASSTAGEGEFVARPGMFVRLERPDVATPTVWIPEDAVVRRGQLDGVFLLDEERLLLRWVRLGVRRGDAVEVLAGVASGDPVVRSPAPGLADGVPVESARTAPWSPGSRGTGSP